MLQKRVECFHSTKVLHPVHVVVFKNTIWGGVRQALSRRFRRR